tara:strand:- start:345 stop:566 length:222 start_codon:yes stop_codon:yes gene_type:complete
LLTFGFAVLRRLVAVDLPAVLSDFDDALEERRVAIEMSPSIDDGDLSDKKSEDACLSSWLARDCQPPAFKFRL